MIPIAYPIRLFVLIVLFSTPPMLSAGTLDEADFAAANSVSIGPDSRADGESAVALGSNGFAQFDFSTAIGALSNANSLQTTVIGAAALAEQPQATALGSFAQVFGQQSTAVGAGAYIEAVNASAMGANALVEANGATVLGHEATAEVGANNAVALGNGSLATEAETVSVGNLEEGLMRRITNVAAAVSEYDAVNLGQLQQSISGVRNDAFSGIAAAAAFNAVMPAEPGKTAISIGTAGYRGEQAVSLFVSHRLKDSQYNTVFNGGVAYDSGSHALGKLGVSWEF